MPKQSLILYCDESLEKGPFYSHFYGGALIHASDREAINFLLNNKKIALNLFKEIKWTFITQQYEKKYIEFIDQYFDLIAQGRIKIRIMFVQNIYKATGLEEHQIDNQYFLLYYQLIKHAFGLRYSSPNDLDETHIQIFLDDVPDTKTKFEEFKAYLSALGDYPIFKRAKITIPYESITDVRSHDHVILQGLDIILGAIQFRLNNKHEIKAEGSKRRGKRTIAKEKVYKHINKRIRDLYPGFNIGCSTGQPNGPTDKWNHPYRHWSFKPSEHEIDLSKGKKASLKANNAPS